jgi:hypothetical protein
MEKCNLRYVMLLCNVDLFRNWTEVNSKRSSRKLVHILSVLVKEIGDLTAKEKDICTVQF